MLPDPTLRSTGQDKRHVCREGGVWGAGERARLGPSAWTGEEALDSVSQARPQPALGIRASHTALSLTPAHLRDQTGP